MEKKNNKPKRAFIPQSIGDAVKKINRNFTSKFGKLEFIIHSNWSKIVGSYFIEFSEPKNITRVPDYDNDFGETIYKNYLNVSVAPAAAIEFQHFKDTVIEKINSYFGYKAIMDLRIHQNYISKSYISKPSKIKNKFVSKNESKQIKNEVGDMKNKDLEESLINLGINITKGSE